MGKVDFHSTKKCVKTQTFQIYGFLKYFRLSRNLQKSQNMGKVIPVVRGKYGKTQICQS